MITWGISANSHDAALAVFDNNRLVFASHSERFSGKKNDADLCNDIVKYAQRWGNPNEIVWYEKPIYKTVRQWYAGQGFNYRNNNVKRYLKQWNISAPISTVMHHESHAAGGFYTSGYKEAAVVVIDAIGEFETLTIWQAGSNGLKRVYSQRYPNSLGLWYSAMTQRCFLKPNEEEYILMGMAAYGNPSKLYDRIRHDFFDDNSSKLVALKGNLHQGCQHWAPDLVVNDWFDIAAATQQIYESYFEKIISKAKTLTGSVNLVIMGGCALNCSANPIAFKHFTNVWIMPNPGDAGSSIGAVLAKTETHMTWTGCDLGYNLKIKTGSDEIVDHLLLNSLCGVAQGRAEFGPRAFGNRSLLADPRGLDIKDRVNVIKRRQQFRPFAPVILEEHADMYFDLCGNSSDHRYMQYISRCRHPDLFPAVIHKDGTSRVQTVPQNATPIRLLLEAWYNKTGCPMLLNTSLNIKGKPMVNNRADAKNFESHYGVKVFT